MANVERQPRLNVFNNVTVTHIAPSTFGIEETEATNRSSFDHDQLAWARQLLVDGVNRARFHVRKSCRAKGWAANTFLE